MFYWSVTLVRLLVFYLFISLSLSLSLTWQMSIYEMLTGDGNTSGKTFLIYRTWGNSSFSRKYPHNQCYSFLSLLIQNACVWPSYHWVAILFQRRGKGIVFIFEFHFSILASAIELVFLDIQLLCCCHQSYRESKVASDVSVIHAVHLVHFLSELMIMLLYLCNMGAINLMESCGKSYYGASELYKLDN